MKKHVKIIALILALVMGVAAFSGCTSPVEEITTGKKTEESEEKTTQEQDSESVIETEDEWKPDIEQKNYGKEFYLNILPDVNPTDFYWARQ